MKPITTISKLKTYYGLVLFLIIANSVCAQTSQQEHMQKLSFMIGDWVGTSVSYENDTISKQVRASEKIRYRLDKNIITIDLESEALKLHTVIYYDEKEATYYYNTYYKNGAGKYVGEYKDGKFIVWPTKNKRFIFNLTDQGNFQEYGEKFENGKWTKYFEDNFKKALKN